MPRGSDHRHLAAGGAKPLLRELRELDENARREALQIGAHGVAVVRRLRGVPERDVERAIVARGRTAGSRAAWRSARAQAVRRSWSSRPAAASRNRTSCVMSLSCCGRWPLRVSRRTSAATSFSITETSSPGCGRCLSSAAVNGLLRSEPSAASCPGRRRERDQRVAAGRLHAGKTAPELCAALERRQAAAEIFGQRIVAARIEENEVDRRLRFHQPDDRVELDRLRREQKFVLKLRIDRDQIVLVVHLHAVAGVEEQADIGLVERARELLDRLARSLADRDRGRAEPRSRPSSASRPRRWRHCRDCAARPHASRPNCR